MSPPTDDVSRQSVVPVTAPGLNELPEDELVRYGRSLGLKLAAKTPKGELVRLIRERQELLLHLERDALLDLVMWARLPVRQSAGKEELVCEIARLTRTNYEDLSERGLVTLALLRGLPASPDEPRAAVIDRLRRAETVGQWMARKGRRLVARVLTRYIEGEPPDSNAAEYRFLPEHGPVGPAPRTAKPSSLEQDIEDRGIVGGLASRLRGAADDYVRAKLDEIESRIDRKLDQIDKRLAEWRDREVANRLKIIRITLAASVVVAGLSLAYKYVESRAVSGTQSRPALIEGLP